MNRSPFIFFAFSILVLPTFFLNAMDPESSGASSSLAVNLVRDFENDRLDKDNYNCVMPMRRKLIVAYFRSECLKDYYHQDAYVNPAT